ncbi:MAG: hypothetical protein M3O68_02065 [Thermoproteota archaeon]|nr:hypothetical protein [Thermoproteota archaeon]
MILTRYWFIISVISLSAVLVIFEIFIFYPHNDFDSNAYGQTSVTEPPNLGVEPTNSSFNAEGTINTILFLRGESNDTQSELNDINTNLSSKYLLGGKWRLDVSKDNVTYFKTNFTMIETDGRNIHYHTIVYKPVSNQSVSQDMQGKLGTFFKNKGSNSSGFNCNVDVYTNGVLEWENVPTTVSFINSKVIMIYIKDVKTVQHFLKSPIYGLINSIDLIQQ